MFYEDIKGLAAAQFNWLTGVKQEVFAQMADALTAYKQSNRKHASRGKPPKLSYAGKLLLLYYREYRTQFHIGATYGIAKSTVCEIIKDTESILLQDKRFHLPGKKTLLTENHFEVVLVDVTECPPLASPKKQRRHYCGKKKRHTQKAQLIVDKSSKQLICTAFDKGRTHDFRLFKESKTALHPSIKSEADTGYQGLAKLHANSVIPKQRSKKQPLSKQDKKQNHQLSSSRVVIENVIREEKIFRIIAERYRNRRKRFGLRFNLIAAICNLNRPPKIIFRRDLISKSGSGM